LSNDWLASDETNSW